MKKILVIVAVIPAISGCSQSKPADRVTVLSPEKNMVLSYRFEMRTDGVSGMETCLSTLNTKDGSIADETIERKETPYKSTEWAEIELGLIVKKIPLSNSLSLRINMQKYRSGSTYKTEEKKEQSESTDVIGDEKGKKSSEAEKNSRDTTFVARVNPQGRITSTDIEGKYWNQRKKELAEGVKKGASKEQADLAMRFETPGVFTALEDALAYLPPSDTSKKSWKVHRKRVLPYHAYGFYMFTNGCAYCEEDSTCTVKSVTKRGKESIVTIFIRGKRIPNTPEPGMPKRVKSLDVKGELELNVTAGVIEKLHIENSANWIHPKKELWKLRNVTTITLQPK